MTIEFNGNACGCCPWRNPSRGIIERGQLLRAHAGAWFLANLLSEVSRESVKRVIVSEVPVDVQDKIDAIVRYVQREKDAIELDRLSMSMENISLDE